MAFLCNVGGDGVEERGSEGRFAVSSLGVPFSAATCACKRTFSSLPCSLASAAAASLSFSSAPFLSFSSSSSCPLLAFSSFASPSAVSSSARWFSGESSLFRRLRFPPGVPASASRLSPARSAASAYCFAPPPPHAAAAADVAATGAAGREPATAAAVCLPATAAGVAQRRQKTPAQAAARVTQTSLSAASGDCPRYSRVGRQATPVADAAAATAAAAAAVADRRASAAGRTGGAGGQTRRAAAAAAEITAVARAAAARAAAAAGRPVGGKLRKAVAAEGAESDASANGTVGRGRRERWTSRYEQLLAALQQQRREATALRGFRGRWKHKRKMSEGTLLLLATAAHGSTGAAGRLLLAPLDQLRILKQLQGYYPAAATCSLARAHDPLEQQLQQLKKNGAPSTQQQHLQLPPKDRKEQSRQHQQQHQQQLKDRSQHQQQLKDRPQHQQQRKDGPPPTQSSQEEQQQQQPKHRAQCRQPQHQQRQVVAARMLAAARRASPTSFWWGCSAPLYASFGSSCVRLALFQRSRFFFTAAEGEQQTGQVTWMPDFFRSLCSSLTVGMAALVLFYPLDVAHTTACAAAANARNKTIESFAIAAATGTPAATAEASNNATSAAGRISSNGNAAATAPPSGSNSMRVATVERWPTGHRHEARPLRLLWRIYKHGGLRTLYTGFSLCAMSLLPFVYVSTVLQPRFEKYFSSSASSSSSSSSLSSSSRRALTAVPPQQEQQQPSDNPASEEGTASVHHRTGGSLLPPDAAAEKKQQADTRRQQLQQQTLNKEHQQLNQEQQMEQEQYELRQQQVQLQQLQQQTQLLPDAAPLAMNNSADPTRGVVVRSAHEWGRRNSSSNYSSSNNVSDSRSNSDSVRQTRSTSRDGREDSRSGDARELNTGRGSSRGSNGSKEAVSMGNSSSSNGEQMWQASIRGAIAAGLVAQLVTYPLDTIRRRRQIVAVVEVLSSVPSAANAATARQPAAGAAAPGPTAAATAFPSTAAGGAAPRVSAAADAFSGGRRWRLAAAAAAPWRGASRWPKLWWRALLLHAQRTRAVAAATVATRLAAAAAGRAAVLSSVSFKTAVQTCRSLYGGFGFLLLRAAPEWLLAASAYAFLRTELPFIALR